MLPGDEQYSEYLEALLQGRTRRCAEIVSQLLAEKFAVPVLYTELFQRALYRVGELWESNRISVAVEHLATAITERMLTLAYPAMLAEQTANGRKAMVSCTVNEYHQVGARMVADIMESQGWDVAFLGANTPVEAMLRQIEASSPEILGLSVSVYFNMASLRRMITSVHAAYPRLDIFVGGQAFRWGGTDIGREMAGVEYIPSLEILEQNLNRR